MFIEFITIIDGDEEKAMFNTDHIVMVRKKDNHAVLCYQQTTFTMIEIKESYDDVLRLFIGTTAPRKKTAPKPKEQGLDRFGISKE